MCTSNSSFCCHFSLPCWEKLKKLKIHLRLVAVKKVAIVDIMDKKTRDKTLKEVKLLQSLEHPNVVAYLDAFLDGEESGEELSRSGSSEVTPSFCTNIMQPNR